MSKSLDQHLEKLSESLEDNPDPWYNNPKGYLKKPDYKRAAQEKAKLKKQSIFTNMLSSNAYNPRWFVLDLDKKLLTYYKDDKPGCLESGHIDMNEIIDVQLSEVFDAPEFSLDLVSKDRHFTVVAESHASMVRWAFAFNLARNAGNSKYKLPQNLLPNRESVLQQHVQNQNVSYTEITPESPLLKWFEYSITFDDPGPLMLNVMGTVDRDRDGNVINNQIIVTSFESFPDGKPGRAETCGKICVRDFLIAVNDVDLQKCNFNDAMDIIINATWPKTLHFKRDNTVSREASRIESWALVYYPSLNRRRRRYIDLRRNEISFRKPAPGGSASAKRDAFFIVDQIVQIRPIVDKTVPSDQQFTLQLICKAKSVVNHVDDDDVSIGGSPVDILELCFPKQIHMNSWRSALVSPSLDINGAPRGEMYIASLPMETIEAADIKSISSATKIGIKSELTGNFSLREFTIHEGYLKWYRPEQDRTITKTAKTAKSRSLFIANSSSCALTQIKLQEDSLEERNGFKFQLVLETTDASVTMGMKDEPTLKQWLMAIKELIAVSPPEQRQKVTMPSTIDRLKGQSKPTDNTENDEDLLSNNQIPVTDEKMVQGYLFKKGEKLAPGIGSDKFKKRWFVLKHFELLYFRSPAESSNLALALGAMDLRAALEVREATDASSPENALEIVTSNRTYILVAEDEEDQIRWVDALADKLEERKVAVQREVGNTGETSSNSLYTNRKELMTKSIVYSGMLAKKTTNPLTNLSVLLDRFFVIANGSFSYYHAEDEYFDEDKRAIADVSLLNITNVCTNIDSKYEKKAFDVTMLTRRGGDANGIRIYTLLASSEDKCIAWMNAICDAVGTLILKKNADGIYQSSVNVDAIKQRDKARVQAAFFKPANAQNIKKAAGVSEKEEVEEEILTEEEKHARSIIAMDRRANTTSMVMSGRGGRGSGNVLRFSVQTRENITSRASIAGNSNSRGSFVASGDVSISPGNDSPLSNNSTSPTRPIRRQSNVVYTGAGRGNRSALRSSGSDSTPTSPAHSSK